MRIYGSPSARSDWLRLHVRGLGRFGSPGWIESSGALLGVFVLWHVHSDISGVNWAPRPALHFFFPALLFICMMRNGGNEDEGKRAYHFARNGMKHEEYEFSLAVSSLSNLTVLDTTEGKHHEACFITLPSASFHLDRHPIKVILRFFFWNDAHFPLLLTPTLGFVLLFMLWSVILYR